MSTDARLSIIDHPPHDNHEVLVKPASCLKILSGSGQRTNSRHNTFHGHGAYNNIVNNFMFFTAFGGRFAIELMIPQENIDRTGEENQLHIPS